MSEEQMKTAAATASAATASATKASATTATGEEILNWKIDLFATIHIEQGKNTVCRQLII